MLAIGVLVPFAHVRAARRLRATAADAARARPSLEQIYRSTLVSRTLGTIAWHRRSAHERRTMAIRQLLPRSPRERALFVAVCIGAGISEELVHRGVLFMLLAGLAGIVAASIRSALAFTMAHALQGPKSLAVVFPIALLAQALVRFTCTLVVAMIVHTLFDHIATARAMRRFRKLDAEGAAG